MSTRQYIGARYTPKFSGPYDATQSYEALDVVDNGSGTTYIARKPVPPNIPLTNTEYWLVYGSSSGAILDLKSRVSEIENTDLPAIDNSINNINGSILTMGGEISANTSNISSLGTRVSRLENAGQNINMRLVVYSDSYGVTVGGVVPFADRMRTLLGLANADFFNLSQGSMGINPNSAVPGGLSSWIDKSYGSVTSPDTITDVLIAMGANDIGNSSNIANAFGNCVTKLRTKFPNAKITLAFIGTSYNRSISEKNAAYNAYRDMATLYRIRFIDNSDLIMRDNTNTQSDDVHPTDDGAGYLANGISYGLINGILHYSAVHDETFNLGNESQRVRIAINDNVVVYSLFDVTLHTGVTLTSNYSEFVKTSASVLRGQGTMVVPLLGGTGSAYGANATLTANNNKYYILSRPSLTNATVFFTGNAATDIRKEN